MPDPTLSTPEGVEMPEPSAWQDRWRRWDHDACAWGEWSAWHACSAVVAQNFIEQPNPTRQVRALYEAPSLVAYGDARAAAALKRYVDRFAAKEQDHG